MKIQRKQRLTGPDLTSHPLGLQVPPQKVFGPSKPTQTPSQKVLGALGTNNETLSSLEGDPSVNKQ